MATLNIGGKDYEAKANFKFDTRANKQYGTKEENYKNGVAQIYQGLLNYNMTSLLQFWDCALAYHKDKPDTGHIEKAIEDRIDEDGDPFPLIKDAFQTMNESGFFKPQVKYLWKQLELSKKPKSALDEESREEKVERIREQERNEEVYNFMKANFDELMASTETKKTTSKRAKSESPEETTA